MRFSDNIVYWIWQLVILALLGITSFVGADLYNKVNDGIFVRNDQFNTYTLSQYDRQASRDRELKQLCDHINKRFDAVDRSIDRLQELVEVLITNRSKADTPEIDP